MRILVIGQSTVHWGRLEFGNIGNFYIIEPFFKQLHRVYPTAEIVTTFQMTEEFCRSAKISCLPMELYYSWTETSLDQSLKELGLASIYSTTGQLVETTEFIDEVLRSDLVVDLSGDIWGDNADFLGRHRFLVGLVKDRVAQLLGKPVVMIAGSPGPFTHPETLGFAREVFAHFSMVTNREPISEKVLRESGFDVSKVRSFACPAFLFEPGEEYKARSILQSIPQYDSGKGLVGVILCGWNFPAGPFDKWPRSDDEFELFAKLIEHITEDLGLQVCLLSHSNGFTPPPQEFELIHGRDYKVLKQLQEILAHRCIATNVFALDGIYDPWTTKAIIGCFDILVSGRIHGAVAGLSQGVPTVIIDYGQAPKAHKLRGFAEVVGLCEYVVDPGDLNNMIEVVDACWKNQLAIRQHLANKIPEVQDLAIRNFTSLLELTNPGS